MKVVIMAGGKGTRIATVKSDVPKPMIPIAGKPILEWQIENLKVSLNRHILNMKKLIKIANSKSDKPEYIKKESLGKMLSGSIETEEFWAEIELFVNENYHGFASCMREQYRELDEQEIRFLNLMCCDFTYGEIALIMGYSKNFISVKRSRIINKLGITVPFDKFVASFKA